MRRPNDLDYIKYVSSGMMGYALNNSRKADLEAISKMPEGKAANHLYLGLGNLGFKEASAEWGITGKGLSNGAIYCDLNNDGRLDLVINSLNAEPVILKNCTPVDKHNYIRIKFKGNEGNRYGTGARVKVWAGGKLFYRQLQPTRGFESSVEPVLHLGLGACTAADSILVIWPDGSYEKSGKTRAQQTIKFRKTGAGGKYNFNLAHKGSNANPGLLSLLPVSTQPVTFLHKENDFTDYNTQPLLPFSLSNEGPHLAIDKDLIYIYMRCIWSEKKYLPLR